MKKTKMNLTHKTDLKIIKYVLLIGLLLMLLIVVFYPHFKPRETVWCYLELNTTKIPRSECVHFKIISRGDIEQIGFDKSQILALNITDTGCYDSYEELPVCSEKEHYFTKLDLTELTEIKVDGVVCAGYYITFYEVNDTLTEYKQDLYRVQDYKEEVSLEELKKLMKDCEV